MMRLCGLCLLVSLGNALRIEPTQQQVDVERSRLDKMSVSLTNLLAGPKVAHSQIAPALRLFTHNLEVVLNETKGMKPVEAMQKLKAASAGISGLLGDISKQQESLMKEDVQQRESLLMGVLMTNKQAPMSEQLDILNSDDFVGLDVSQQLLHSHDEKTPLYMQAATWLDGHKNASGVPAKQKALKDTGAIAATFDRRVAALEKQNEQRHEVYKREVQDLTASVQKGNKHAKILLKRAEHMYKKATAQTNQYINNLKAAAAAIRSGDPKAVASARDALSKSLDSLRGRSSGVLYFLQEGSALFQQDCPYCAAQCVEKCHNKGEPYVQCLGECADAGKR